MPSIRDLRGNRVDEEVTSRIAGGPSAPPPVATVESSDLAKARKAADEIRARRSGTAQSTPTPIVHAGVRDSPSTDVSTPLLLEPEVPFDEAVRELDATLREIATSVQHAQGLLTRLRANAVGERLARLDAIERALRG